MYLVATAHVVGSAWPFNSASDDWARSLAIDELLTSIATLNFVLGDGIVMWRAYVIWERSRHILGISLLLLFLMVGASIWQITYTAIRVQSHIDHVYQTGVFMTLLANVVATGLIGYRAWRHYRSSSVVKIRIQRDRALAVLLLLVESGALYCAIWIAVISLCVRPASTVSVLSHASEIVAAALPQIGASDYMHPSPGMYPTVLVVLCKLQASYSNTIMDMRDDSPPLPALPPDASVALSLSSNNHDLVRVQFSPLPGDGGQGFNNSDTSLGSVSSPAADLEADKVQTV
ncbi:hypothetical protein FA95DRAFT_1573987 [Auriscalpium vulgare]|uniref:Uncharacterized protein n=1 Tax=Auriscalpium vulgare TaxID=40419 RepID=A0ACB8RMW1_9AGAM|nr:hypothetical protein FA95DRAFT_1573987 [Auriscalpium vulgare]